MFCLFSFLSVLNSNVINILAAIFFLPSLGYFWRRNCEKRNYWFKVCVKYYSFWQVLLNSPSKVICQTDAIISVLLECLLEKAMAPHSSTLAWKIPWTKEPGRLQSMGSLRVGHDWATSLSLFTFTFHFHTLEKEMATHSSVLAWRIPGTGEPGGLLFMGSHRVGHNWSNLATAAAAECLFLPIISLSFFYHYCIFL